MSKRGFTLVEVILVIVVIALGLVVVLEGISRGITLLDKTKNEVIAINLAREGMEAVYNIRNTNRLRRSGARDAHRLRTDSSDPASAWMGESVYVTENASNQRILTVDNPTIGSDVTLDDSLGMVSNPGVSCLHIRQARPSAPSGLYYLQAGSMGTPQQYYCDMTTAGGGWMLLFQRRGGNINIESCGSNLNSFLHGGSCGSVNNLNYGNSYNANNVNLTIADFPPSEYLNMQYNSSMQVDSDDAFILHTNNNIFPNQQSDISEISIDKICDIDNTNCDDSDVLWKYVGTSRWSGALCNGGYNGSTSYKGMYGYCASGNIGDGANNGFGNRGGGSNSVAYNEVKLRGLSYSSADDYVERVFIRSSSVNIGGSIGDGWLPIESQYRLCLRDGQYVSDSSCPDEQLSNYYRAIVGKGLYDKNTGAKLECTGGTGDDPACSDDSAKEYRFCSIVYSPSDIDSQVELCGAITNFKE